MKLYENDPYCKSFTAKVEECIPADGKYHIVLSQTAFFPEGGGQAADEGTLNGIPVLDVQEKNGVVYHTLDSEIKAGETVQGGIDWDLRYARMQSHTGEHILAGTIHSLFGYDNVGFHMSEKIMLVDFNGSLTADDMHKVEIIANKAIYKNADVTAYYPTEEEIQNLTFRSKKEFESGLRIVKIGEDIDCCACCAPHVSKTGEVGVIKVVDFYAFKQGTRIELIAGINALTDYISLNSSVKEMMKILSSPREEILGAVTERNNAYQALKGENGWLSKRLAFSELDLKELSGGVYAISENLSFDELRHCSNQLTEKDYNLCMLFSKNEAGGYSYVISSKTADVRPVVKSLNEAFSGKGGGKSDYSQGKIESFPIEDIIKFAEEVLK